jgi:hypothetical protein
MSALIVSCEGCKTEFTPKWKRARFCSKACSNKTCKRRKKKEVACSYVGCNNIVDFYRHSFCRQCKDLGRHFGRAHQGKLITEITIKEYCSKKRSGANRFDNIRHRAKKMFSNLKLEKCTKCNWPHHVEVCHIKAISKFPEETLVSEVNKKENLVLLCPNCHWLYDNNLLKL